MTEQGLPPPPVMWAQTSATVLVTVNLEDSKDPEVKITKDSIYFKGSGGPDQKIHEVTIPLYKEINAEESKYFNKGRSIEIILAKTGGKTPFWPALTSDNKKHHWLKCDFNKWRDEEDSEDEGGMDGSGGKMGNGDWEDMMRKLGGLGGGGGDDKPGLDDLNIGDEDSDDEQIPDLESNQ